MCLLDVNIFKSLPFHFRCIRGGVNFFLYLLKTVNSAGPAGSANASLVVIFLSLFKLGVVSINSVDAHK